MSKKDFAAELMKKADLKSRAQAEAVYDIVISSIMDELSAGKSVSFRNFGTFSVTTRKARTCINPATRKKMAVPERKTVKFTPGKDLKETAAILDKGLGRERLAFRELTRNVEKQLKDIRSKMETYRRNPDKFSAETKKYLSDTRDKLSKNMEEASSKFRELSEHGGEALKELKKGLDGAIAQLKDSFKRARKKF